MNTKFTLKLLSLILALWILASSFAGCMLPSLDGSGSSSSSSTSSITTSRNPRPTITRPTSTEPEYTTTQPTTTQPTTQPTTTKPTTTTPTTTTTTKPTTTTTTTTTRPTTNTTTGPDITDPPLDHSDIDNNGWCDDCGIDVVETIDFYNFNDLHGKFTANDDQPGVGKLTTFLINTISSDEHTVFLSSGDMWQGGAESNGTKGKIIVDWMNQLGFEAMALGNHEFDWGQDYIRINSELAEFPFLAINIYDNATGERVKYCEASVMVERGGAQIGIIGAIGDCYSSILAEMTTGINFKTGSALTNLIKEESQKLRAAGADFIVYLIHDGESYSNAGDTSKYYDQTLSRDGYVDLVFEGHSHSYYIFTDNYGIPHLQGGGDNSKGMTHVEVEVNFANGNVVYNTTNYISHNQCTSLTDSELIDQLIEKYWAEIENVVRDLGYNAKYRNSDEIAQLVAKLYYEAGVAKWGNEYNIVLGGGSLNLRSPYEVNKGDVKYSDLQTILPFDNKLKLCAIKGSDLISKFLNNSSYTVYSTITASQVDRNATYYIIADSWTSDYAWAKCTPIDVYDETTFARDLLAEYIQQGGWAK